MVIAHKGYRRVAQENTFSAFDAAIKAGATGIECDLMLTADQKAIVYHNRHLDFNNQKYKISKLTLKESKDIFQYSGQKLLELDQLFEYIREKDAQFFLELKTSSPILVESIIDKVSDMNLWKKVNVIGIFPFLAKNALRAQAKYPKLQVGQFLYVPIYHYLKYLRKPKKSYSIFLGWHDEIRGSQTLFKTLVSPKRLAGLKNMLEKLGFNVKAGVINNDSGLDLFRQAGITDIVTDKVSETVDYFKQYS